VSGFRVDAGALAAHATDLDVLAARVRAAATASQPLDVGAYGVIGKAFAHTAAEAATTGAAAVTALAQQAEALASSVRATARAYDATERGVSGSLGGGS
jgi:hypothetical protein